MFRNIHIRSLVLPRKKAETFKCYETTTNVRNQLKTKQLDSLSHNTGVVDREKSFAKLTHVCVACRGGDAAASLRWTKQSRNRRLNQHGGDAAPPRQNRKPLSPAGLLPINLSVSIFYKHLESLLVEFILARALLKLRA